MTTRGKRTLRADCGTREVRIFQAERDFSAVEARDEDCRGSTALQERGPSRARTYARTFST